VGAGARTQNAAEMEPHGQVAIATGTRPRVALAHDWLVGMRGGERVLDSIARLCADRFEIVGLFTMFDDGRPHTPTIDGLTKYVSSIGSLPGASGRARRWLLPLYPRAVAELGRQLAFEHARRPIDLVISTSSAAIKGLRPPNGVPHICYCHTPARYLWSQTDRYTEGGGLAARLRSIGFGLFGNALRKWDRNSAAHVTTFIANSTHIQREIHRCYNRESIVIHPPVRTNFFTLDSTQSRFGKDPFWLCVGALEPYKNVDLAIRAACFSEGRLTIVGEGSQEPSLRRLEESFPMRHALINFLGRLSDEDLRSNYRTGLLLVFPQIEDFGITAVEAQACGMPVVALRAGGALDSVIENQTGVFFDHPTPEALALAVRECLKLGDVSAACRANAERFSEARFERAMLSIINRTLAKS
jgi:glycosyltransferase involved in cell wall biosynthesis